MSSSEKESSEEKTEREIKGRHKGGVNKMDKTCLHRMRLLMHSRNLLHKYFISGKITLILSQPPDFVSYEVKKNKDLLHEFQNLLAIGW